MNLIHLATFSNTMINLGLFFDFFDAETAMLFQQQDTLGHEMQIATGEHAPWQTAQVALFSIANNTVFEGDVQPADDPMQALRRALYALTPLSNPCQCIDLGTLRAGETLEVTAQRLKEVCEMLIAHNTLPVILAYEHALDYGQFMAYENLEKIVSVLNVDARIDLATDANAPLSDRHIHQILVHHPNFLFEYAHLAHQRYLVGPPVLKTLQKLNYDHLSVGQIRDALSEVEPVVRSADMLSFDLAALKIPYGSAASTPFGLTPEEACQLCWYAGLTEKLSSAGFYGLMPAEARNALATETLAVMLWYFLEGFAQRKPEMSFKSNFHVKYTVTLADDMPHMVFYKSKVTDKWWMEVAPENGAKERFDRALVIPCSYEDYATATSGQVPIRWIRAVEKFS